MTDPITQVAEEMEEFWIHPYEELIANHTVERLAVRLLAYWTPERRAFVEAAEKHCANIAKFNPDYLGTLQDAFHAMIEAEKGEK